MCDRPFPSAAEADAFVHHVVRNWRSAGLSERAAVLCAYAEKVTLHPAECRESDLVVLRDAGWSDTAIHDAVQIVAYFNYINRVADALGVQVEPGARIWGDPES